MKKLKKLLLITTVGLLILTLSACSKGVGTSKDGNEQKIEKAAMNLVTAVDKNKYKLISTEELKKWIDNKEDMILVDTMPADAYAKQKIPGAINATLPTKMDDVTTEQKEAFLKILGDNKNKKIVVYCGFVACERSDVAATIAKEAGFTEVYRQPGGIVSWIDAGYELAK
ncbi:rhodanese-like domain-containing protein [Gemella sp. GH3]|uniref:rhodanese-like domain-containing protein n=1 Tax=unclassified Gemella TaxID=2624949 RepID=UPI0015D0AF6D|nr:MULTISPECIES: rhodanese-like domain-containing protein [unclassified Gemella]MBF0713519.1 rhodanese-like domain-containing protein [Gemella sp. GH3.1]NYS50471.1 rhodanese-like domain-containing protein [Gemella sp. GH3]